MGTAASARRQRAYHESQPGGGTRVAHKVDAQSQDVAEHTPPAPPRSTQRPRGRTTKALRHRDSFLRRIAQSIRTRPVNTTLKPAVNFLTIISSLSTSLASYIDTLCTEITRHITCDAVALCFVNEATDSLLRVVACTDAKQGADAQTSSELMILWSEQPRNAGVVGHIISTAKGLNLRDISTHPRYDGQHDTYGEHIGTSMCCQPVHRLSDHHIIIGAIAVLGKQGDIAFTPRDAERLRNIAMQISDSYYRQRFKAIESQGDSHAVSLLAHYDSGHGANSVKSRKRTNVDGPSASSAADDDVNSILKDSAIYSWPLRAGVRGLLHGFAPGIPSDFRTLDFTALDYDPNALERFVQYIFADMGIVQRFRIPEKRLKSWVSAVRMSYRSNPFHNWLHGYSVLHFCYYQLLVSQIGEFLHDLDVFGLLIAALSHDADHPGKTNQFCINVEDELATIYNDVSVLENHHAYVACRLLRENNCMITLYLDKPDRRAIRKIIITSILATDMSHHEKHCKIIASRDKLRPFTSTNAADRQMLLDLVIHCSDLSAQVQPWNIARRWEKRISVEFSQEAAELESLGLTPAPFMLNLDSETVRAKGQMSKFN